MSRSKWLGISVVATTVVLTATSARSDTIPVGDGILAPGSPLSNEYVLGPSSPGKWGAAGYGNPGGTVTWSIMAAGIASEDASSTVALSSIFPAGYHAQIVAAFAAWSAVANIN